MSSVSNHISPAAVAVGTLVCLNVLFFVAPLTGKSCQILPVLLPLLINSALVILVRNFFANTFLKAPAELSYTTIESAPVSVLTSKSAAGKSNFSVVPVKSIPVPAVKAACLAFHVAADAILASANVSVVILSALKLGISAATHVPVVEIIDLANVPLVILEAAKLGISVAAKPSSKIFNSAAVAVILKSLKSSTLAARLVVKSVTLLCAIEPASMALVIPDAFTLNSAVFNSIDESSKVYPQLKVLPLLDIPVPAVI